MTTPLTVILAPGAIWAERRYPKIKAVFAVFSHFKKDGVYSLFALGAKPA